jgi:hypothetical protein
MLTTRYLTSTLYSIHGKNNVALAFQLDKVMVLYFKLFICNIVLLLNYFNFLTEIHCYKKDLSPTNRNSNLWT